jgi:hypothetical protein
LPTNHKARIRSHPIRRFSIAKVMAVIALIAANSAVLRACYSEIGRDSVRSFLLGGLLPLVNAQIVCLFVLARRYRISLRRRTPNRYRSFAFVFAILNAVAILFLTTVRVLAPLPAADLIQFALHPLEPWFNSLPQQNSRSWLTQFVVVTLLVAVALSGPPLLVTLVISWLSSRYEWVVVDRKAPSAFGRNPSEENEAEK